MLPDGLAQSALEESLIGDFWASYYPSHGRVLPSHESSYSTGGWTTVVQALYRSNSAVKMALMANCYSLVGKKVEKQDMVEQGFRYYGRAMAELRRGINMSSNDGLVSTVRLLIMFQVGALLGTGRTLSSGLGPWLTPASRFSPATTTRTPSRRLGVGVCTIWVRSNCC